MFKKKKKEEPEYIYTYGGQDYSFHELAELIMNKCQMEEDKKGFWKSMVLARYPFQTGFNEGLLMGTLLMTDKASIRKNEKYVKEQEREQDG